MTTYTEQMDPAKKAALIQATELFSPLSLSQVLPIAERCSECFFPQGSIILRENEQGSTLRSPRLFDARRSDWSDQSLSRRRKSQVTRPTSSP